MARHSLSAGITIAIAVLDRGIGHGKVESITSESINISVRLEASPLPRVPIQLLCAVPRPQTVKKLLHLASSTGLVSLFFFASDRIVPGYQQSKSLDGENIQSELILGLEQSGDCVFPKVKVYSTLKSVLAELKKPPSGHAAFFAHTFYQSHSYEEQWKMGFPLAGMTLALGPEAGWSEYEVSNFGSAGFLPVWLGPRQYRVEIAATLLIGMAMSRLLPG